MNYMGGYSAPPAGVSPEVQQWFNTVDRDRSGKIDSKKLQSALINGNGTNFSDTACTLMIKMFDTDHTGTIEVQEFEQLYNYVNAWINMFRQYDRDNSGSIEEPEFNTALQQMGYQFSNEFIHYIIAKNDPLKKQQLTVDQFIVFCVQLQRATEKFRAKDTEQKGTITIAFEDFIEIVISCFP